MAATRIPKPFLEDGAPEPGIGPRIAERTIKSMRFRVGVSFRLKWENQESAECD